MNLKHILGLSLLALVVTVAIAPKHVDASDHDDGEVDTKGRNVNLTDLYAFREQDQNQSAGKDDLILVMNSNPRSVARQQYYFSNNARYEFKVSRVANKNDAPTGREDVVLSFQFSPPNAKGQQEFQLNADADGHKQAGIGKTTPLNPEPNASPVVNNLYLGKLFYLM